jgi:hypothetical protein
LEIKITQGLPDKLFNQVAPIVEECFEGIWSAKDLQKLLEMPHDSKIMLVASDNDKTIGYCYLAIDYDDILDAKIASIQEICVLPDYRETDASTTLLKEAIEFAKKQEVDVLEQTSSSLDQWIIPSLLSEKFIPSEIKADREISTLNEVKLLSKKLSHNKNLNVLANQVIYEQEGELDVHLFENEAEFDEMTKENLVAFSSIVSLNGVAPLEESLNELNEIDVEWDEINVTFNYYLSNKLKKQLNG